MKAVYLDNDGYKVTMEPPKGIIITAVQMYLAVRKKTKSKIKILK